MEHDDPEQHDDEHSDPSRALGAEQEPARSENRIDEAVRGHPLDSVGGIGLAEGFSEQADLGRVLGKVS